MPGSKNIYPFSDTSLPLRINNKQTTTLSFSHFLDVDTLFEDLSSRGGGGGAGGGGEEARGHSGFSRVSICVQTLKHHP